MVQVSAVGFGKMKEIEKRFQAPAEFVAHLWCGTLMPHYQRHWKHVVPASQRVLLVSCNTPPSPCKLHVYYKVAAVPATSSLPRKKREKSSTCKDIQEMCLKPVVTSCRDLPLFRLYMALRLPGQVFWIPSSIDEYRKDKSPLSLQGAEGD